MAAACDFANTPNTPSAAPTVQHSLTRRQTATVESASEGRERLRGLIGENRTSEITKADVRADPFACTRLALAVDPVKAFALKCFKRILTRRLPPGGSRNATHSVSA